MDGLQMATDTANGSTLLGMTIGIFLFTLALVLWAALITVPFLLRKISRRLDGIHSELRGQNKASPGRQVLGGPTKLS